MSDLLQKAIDELRKLPEDRQDAIAARILELLESEDDESEEEWEERVLNEALGDALLPDGNIDTDKLRARGRIVSLDELYPQGDADDES
jgi:hypothetical protein